MRTPPVTSRRTVLRTFVAALGSATVLSGSAVAVRGGFQRELAIVRSATADYNDPAVAYADGFSAFGHDGPVPLEDAATEGEAVCGMGVHFIDLAFLGALQQGPDAIRTYFDNWDGIHPQALAYGIDDEDDLLLGAVEWIIPELVDPDPDLFEHDDGAEVWEAGPGPGVNSLHAWVHTHNPDGVLEPTNPRQQFHPEGCHPH